jgi:transcriptional regulator of heat shock response
MVKHVDAKEREFDILDLIIKSYIQESKPISSHHLCECYGLSYSSATIRNIMESLEKKGFLSHIHTSSGRVPTKNGFKYYVSHINEESFTQEYPVTLNVEAPADINELIERSLDTLAQASGYTSLLALSGREEKLLFRGARFMLEQPEFEDINRLKNLFYALEVKINQLYNLLFAYLDEKMKIFIGDDIGFAEIADCSLLISGAREKEMSFSLGLLGPIRMDYIKASSCLYSIRTKLKGILEQVYE